jgi:hypothetical protein
VPTESSRTDRDPAPPSEAPAVSSPRLIFAVSTLILLGSAYRFRFFTVDDAYITFRYAQNLVAGHGLVFNAGERVEGYTNFLLVLWSALALLLSIDPETWVRGLTLLSCLGILAAVIWFGPPPTIAPLAAWAGPLFVAVQPAVSVWAVAGLEEPLFACLLCWAVVLMARGAERGQPPLPAAVLLGLAALTRPEGLGAALATAAAAMLCQRRPLAWRAWARWAALLLAFVLPHLAWRWSYYGYPLPNTFYAKVGATLAQVGRGIEYTQAFFSANGYWLLAVPLGSLVCARRRAVAVVAIVALWWLAVVIVLGGDNQPMYRFFVPLIGLYAVLLGWGMQGWVQWVGARRWAVAAAAPVLAIALAYSMRPAFHGDQYEFVLQHSREVAAWQQIGLWFRQRAEPDQLLAVLPAGAMPYFSELPALDMLGLNDAHIAHREMPGMGSGPVGHEKYDANYVLGRAPTYIVIGVYDLAPQPVPLQNLIAPDYAVEHELLRHRDFRAHYRPRVAHVPGGYFAFYERRPEG